MDRHVQAGSGDKLALRWLGKDGARRDLTYRDLATDTNRFANLLARLGVSRGECVFSLLGRDPALYVAALGTLKAGGVFSPMFSAFGPEPLQTRLALGDARVLVTSEALYRRKVAPIRDALPGLRHVLITGGVRDALPPGGVDLDVALPGEAARFEIAATTADDPALLHFTSGTTGRPKGAIHAHAAVIAHHVTGRYALDLHPEDIYWCTADPGWVTGMSYGIIAPLTNGVTMIVDEAVFDAGRWLDLLARERVSVWYTAPTAIRMLMRIGEAAIRATDLSALRFMASVGEPLNPEIVDDKPY